jgi:regulatory protein
MNKIQNESSSEGNSRNTYSAFDTAAYFLSFKDRTVKELTDKLREKKYSEAEIDDAISKLLHYGYLDDKRYTAAYIRSNQNRKGINLIKRELYSKGVARSVVDDFLESRETDLYSEKEVVRDIYNRRFLGVDICDVRQKRKIYSYFQRRGFSFEVIKNVISDTGEE